MRAAGKTTLLNYILGAQHGLRIACVINDMSEVNIDAALIAQGSAALSRVENKLVRVSGLGRRTRLQSVVGAAAAM
ncbi:hypothetical protein EON67_02770 [archaeon]|nr:MAG: hypothetical protein EON67_02770 [archaeon]